jgi:hypothetical protein
MSTTRGPARHRGDKKQRASAPLARVKPHRPRLTRDDETRVVRWAILRAAYEQRNDLRNFELYNQLIRGTVERFWLDVHVTPGTWIDDDTLATLETSRHARSRA